jgi:hypothetical protein
LGAVVVEELGHRARGAAGDLLEGVGRVVVLAGEDRPLARDEQLSRPCRYPGAGEAAEELPLGRDRKVTRPVAPITAVVIVCPFRKARSFQDVHSRTIWPGWPATA